MGSIVEDKKIWDVFRRIIWLDVQLNETMRAGEEEPIFGYIKESNLLSVDRRNQYESERARLGEELYHHLLFNLNRIEIRESLEDLDHVKALKALRDGYFELADVWDDYKEKIIKYHIMEELVDRDLFFENYYSLDPPYVKIGTKIPERIKSICNESRLCYVFRQYNATIVLSRTVVESIVKKKCSNHGIKEKNFGKDLKEAKNVGIISDRAHQIANKIRLLGNKVVHGAKLVTEKEAKQTLNDILIFFEEVYF